MARDATNGALDLRDMRISRTNTGNDLVPDARDHSGLFTCDHARCRDDADDQETKDGEFGSHLEHHLTVELSGAHAEV